MLLESKSAIVYGGGGSIGGAVARAFAAEGARVFLAGRTLGKLESVAEAIRSAGGVAHVAGPSLVGGWTGAFRLSISRIPPADVRNANATRLCSQ